MVNIQVEITIKTQVVTDYKDTIGGGGADLLGQQLSHNSIPRMWEKNI